MSDEHTLTLNHPLTEEQWDAITDVDFDYTDRIWFNTKHGKTVEFVKRKRGKWIFIRGEEDGNALYECSECGKGDIHAPEVMVSYCWNCGADMRGDSDEA